MTGVTQTYARVAPRFSIGLPVELAEGVGTTRDLGTSGVYFTSRYGYEPSSKLEFTIVLDSVNENKPLRMRCSGEVVRVETVDDMVGIAARILEYAIEAPVERF
jgi:hypothetical protein